MKDFSGWIRYVGMDAVTFINIKSPDGSEQRSLADKEVVAWLAIAGNAAKLV
jgi:hypothetical protein